MPSSRRSAPVPYVKRYARIGIEPLDLSLARSERNSDPRNMPRLVRLLGKRGHSAVEFRIGHRHNVVVTGIVVIVAARLETTRPSRKAVGMTAFEGNEHQRSPPVQAFERETPAISRHLAEAPVRGAPSGAMPSPIAVAGSLRAPGSKPWLMSPDRRARRHGHSPALRSQRWSRV